MARASGGFRVGTVDEVDATRHGRGVGSRLGRRRLIPPALIAFPSKVYSCAQWNACLGTAICSPWDLTPELSSSDRARQCSTAFSDRLRGH